MKLNLIEEFNKKMKNKNLNVYGVLDSDMNVLTLGTDSKIIGRIFEMITEPVLQEIANENNYTLSTPESQTVYPDFVLTHNDTNEKIAIDVKSTYKDYNRNGELKDFVFTLGSYASYLRDNTKNIEGQYTDYSSHYVIGFVYDRNGSAQQSQKSKLEDVKTIQFPYQNVEYFIQEKYKIVGEKPGSGNTENIGSIHSNSISDFEKGTSPFAVLGEDIYNLYWSYYPKYRSQTKEYTNLEEFIEWYRNKRENIPVRYDEKEYYNYDDVIRIIEEYEINNK